MILASLAGAFEIAVGLYDIGAYLSRFMRGRRRDTICHFVCGPFFKRWQTYTNPFANP